MKRGKHLQGLKKIKALIFISRIALTVICSLPLIGAADSNIDMSANSADFIVPPHAILLPPIPPLTNDMSNFDSYAAVDKTIQRFMSIWRLHGASVAIAKDGKLLYAKGFGYADIERKIEATPQHIFRVASASKLLTAAAIMRLVEDGKIRLNDHVFGKDGILNDTKFLQIRDNRATKITVFHLLEHSGGWNSARYGDPMLMHAVIARERNLQLPIDIDDIIQFVLSKRLHFEVGTRSCYSNVGFAILGRVIEKVSGMSYEDYVNQELLWPLSINDASIGKSYPQHLYSNEVSYYDDNDRKPIQAYDNAQLYVPRSRGGNDIHTLGAAGGWVMSATSLLRIALSLDGEAAVPDILKPMSVAFLAQHRPHFSALGWRTTSARRLLRTGSLSGTSAVVVCDTTGWSYAFVTNTSSWQGSKFTRKIVQMMDRLLMRQNIRWRYDDNLFAPPAPTDAQEPPLPLLASKEAVVED